ncbi:MAG TPA: trigger factor [Candidatus Limenecus avicola]|mgnify:FL=1|uniref:Trigger factor n=1 Tax=Candidatus Limenecus avicola TaxID=2840847 RepID=A0A9D1N274_9CLOT|nr:trigger factor [Candidatus Limenecus avicola]
MKTTVEKLENNMVKVDIEIDAETAEKEYNKACKRLAQRVNIPGFRKGKAPKAILEKNIGAEAIKHDVMDSLLPSAFAQAIKENDLNIITEPAVESYDFEIGKPVKIVAKMELKPEVKFEQYKDLEVEVEEFKTAEDAMEKEIEELTEKFTTLQTVSDRESTDKDVVMMDFEGSVDGNLIDGGSAKNYMLDLEHSNFIPGFAEQLVGHKTGEEFTIDVTFPENYHDEKLKGKPAQFKIKINEIKEKIKPELNDELAKKVGNFKSVDELKADIQKYLDNTAKVENDKRSANKLFETIMEKMSVEVQPSMIEREKQALLIDFKQKVAQSGVNWDDVMKNDGPEKIDEELKTEALNRIKNSLMMSEIAKLENIQVTPQDLEQKIGELAMMYQTDKGTIFKEIARNTAMIQSLSQQALTQKVTKFLLENNKIKFVAGDKK